MIAAATAPTKDGFPMYDTFVGWNLVVDALKKVLTSWCRQESRAAI